MTAGLTAIRGLPDVLQAVAGLMEQVCVCVCVCARVQKGSTSRVIRLGSYISFLLLAGIE
jgi:phosphatidylserine decarboxylase